MRKELGKISSASFGYGGYQDAMVGFSLSFESGGGGVSTFEGSWPLTEDVPVAQRHSREKLAIAAVLRLTETIQKAKVHNVSELVGIPVELTYDGQMLKSWRILDEVL